MVSVEELKSQIKTVEEKLSKYDSNSIMGVHWSSKLAGLKRELSKNEIVKTVSA